MNILVTGSNGFIGKNLLSHLKELDNINVITYEKEDNFSKIIQNIDNIDVIFHLAGVNRPTNSKEFYEGNTDLTKQIVDLIKEKDITFIMTSSIQAEKENDYGNSKLLAENYVKDNLKNYYIYRLHNVFGKWCRPNYNSVVATFCNNIANDLEIRIDNPDTVLELVYIDDIIYEFIDLISKKNVTAKINDINYINTRYKVTLEQLATYLKEFKNNLDTIYIPNTGNNFVKKLYSTFISYIPKDKMIKATVTNVDERGSFTELLRTTSAGQVSISVSKPGIVRGNHYHHTKIEKFIVIKGKAKVYFQNILDENDKYDFTVDGNEIKEIIIPVGYSHSIENIGNDDMILCIWCNELFDKDNPDTYFKKIR